MPIDVICPGCRARFSVSDKFAGKKGPCPKCKAEITVPSKGEEVVVHEPEQFGPKTTSGVAVLKPITRKETKLTPVAIVGIVGAILLVFACAFLLRSLEEIPRSLLAVGAVVIAAPLVLAGYTFLRDDELEPYRGISLAIRVVICSIAYAVLWGVFAWLPSLAFHLEELQVFHLIFLIPPIAGLGALASQVSLDLDFGNALIHYGLYVLVTSVLCMIMGVPLVHMAAI
jgi:hypothetical protein